jgi:hypothetical protein
MIAKIVCRLLDRQNKLLGWTEHHAQVRGDGCLRSSGPVVVPIETSGAPAFVSLHWADVNVETRIPCPEVFIQSGNSLLVFADGAPMVTLGVPPVGLPPVTVGRPVSITVPVGQLGSRGLA